MRFEGDARGSGGGGARDGVNERVRRHGYKDRERCY